MTHILLSRGILNHPHVMIHTRHYIKSHHQVTILALSHFEHQFNNHETYMSFYSKGGEYYDKMVQAFIPYDISEAQIHWIYEGIDTKEEAIQKIQSSDILYFPGGAPDLMMRRIEQLGIKEAIEAHQKIYIGSSAGAMIQVKNYHISKDYDYPRFSYESGLNLIDDLSIEVHYRRRKVQKSAMRKVFRSYQHPIYIIPDDGALIICDHAITPIGSARLYYDKHGVVK